MARIKFASGVDPIRGKSNGFTFQWNTAAHNMYAKSRNSRNRYPNQSNSQQFLWRALSSWRNMPAGVKQAWSDYAAAYPEPSKHNPAVMLSGYQLFLKRNSYVSLNCGLDYDFMTAPSMEVLPAPSVSFELKAGTNSIDVTEMYLKYFGVLPSPGQSVLFRCIPMSQTSGQFFDVINDVLTVEEIYVDGFFINLIFPANPQNLLFSIFLSKPVSPGMSYAGTKIRYMGCFGSKTFVGLSDVPAIGVPDAGKVWGVKPDGTWGVIEGGGGGGLTCEDLVFCPTIQSILSSVVPIIEKSIPEVHFGLCYSQHCFIPPYNIAPPGWYVPSAVQLASLFSYIATIGNCSDLILENSLLYFNALYASRTNALKFNGRGAGYTDRVHTGFLGFKGGFYLWSSTYTSSMTATYNMFTGTNPMPIVSTKSYQAFMSIRLFKSSTNLSEGEVGSFISWSGKAYRTICINGIEIMSDNLSETTLPDGSAISLITYPPDANGKTYPLYCYANLDSNNT